MNKFYVFLLAYAAAGFSLRAQTIFSDDFSDQSLPNWTIVNNNPNSNVIWKWNQGQSGGQATGNFDAPGAANGCIIADSDGDGNNSGTVKESTFITSKAINTNGFNTVKLSFFEYFAKYQQDTPRVFISNDSVNWTVVHNPAAGLFQDQATANPRLVEVNVTSVAGNQNTVYIRFSWKGSFDYWWFIDDVRLFQPSTTEVEAVAFNNELTNGCNLSSTEQFQIVFRNKGLNAIDSLTAYYQIGTGAVVSEKVVLASPLALDSVFTHTFAQTADLSAANVYNITGWVALPGDTIATNDSAQSVAISANPITIPGAYTTSFEIPGVGNDVSALTWTTLDANNDGVTWFLSVASAATGSVHYRYLWNTNGTTGGNDWLFSPCLNLAANKAYKISFFNEVGEDNNGLYEEKLEVKYGTMKSAMGMSNLVADFGTLGNTEYEERKAAFKPASGGTYYVGLHCYSDPDKWFLNIDDLTIDELLPPTANFTVSNTGTLVTVTDASSELITNWQWNWGDNTTGTGENPGPHTYNQPGTYEICLIVTNLAGSDTTCKTITITGVEDLATQNMAAYPNPARNLLNVAFTEAIQKATIEVVNTMGEVMLSQQATGKVQQISLRNLAEGVYYVRVKNEQGTIATSKFIHLH